jgi:CBS domain-containing protein
VHVSRICTKETIAVGPDDLISRVAHQMRENHVGAVVVQEDGRPVGIVTDRDITLRCGGRRDILADIPVREIMTKNVVTAAPNEDVLDVLDRMRENGVRRIPVLNDAGLLAGMVTLDDILLHVARSMRHVAEVVMAELQHEG